MRTKVKTQIKKLLQAVEEKKTEEAGDALRLSISLFQKSVSKGVHHRNTASRKISRLARKVNELSQ